MNNTPSKLPAHPEARFRDAGIDVLIKDVSRLGPAPTPSRELFATVVNIVVVGAGLAIVRPEPVVAACIAAAFGLYIAIRWTAGSKKWGQR